MNKKMNNKGFSLVELIVVVLIMAIIAVALAPQVMKWVDESRISTDIQMYDNMFSCVQTALADEEALAEVKTTAVEITIEKTGVKIDGTAVASAVPSGASAFVEELYECCPDISKIKAKTGSGYKITATTSGTVERTTPPVSGEAE